ncbi:hypothetical protein D3C75_708580 [compost metagenome]
MHCELGFIRIGSSIEALSLNTERYLTACVVPLVHCERIAKGVTRDQIGLSLSIRRIINSDFIVLKIISHRLTVDYQAALIIPLNIEVC